MKKLFGWISSNERQVIELIILFAATIIPFFIDLHELFKDYLSESTLSTDNFFWLIAIEKGKGFAAIIIFCALLMLIRRINKDFVMNHKYLYHDYCYAWYWVCAKILGIRKCNLELVPINMQFKLVLRGTFAEYPFEISEYPSIDDEPECHVSITDSNIASSEINMIIEDTYIIERRQIPESKQCIKTITITRNDGTDHSRHFSQQLINAVVNSARSICDASVVNVFSTTNSLNTKHIASSAFGLSERGNINHLYVFQQEKNGIRKFEPDGYKIY